MKTRNESGLEKPATFNSVHVWKAHVLSGHGSRLVVAYILLTGSTDSGFPPEVFLSSGGLRSSW